MKVKVSKEEVGEVLGFEHTYGLEDYYEFEGEVVEENKLKNGGKPHVCGQIAIHNTPTDKELYLCSRCNMPVDFPEPLKEIERLFIHMKEYEGLTPEYINIIEQILDKQNEIVKAFNSLIKQK